MKFLLLLFLLTGTLRGSSQELTDLVMQAGEWFQKEEYAKAIPLAEKAAAEVEKLLGKENIIYRGMLTVQAYGYYKLCRYNKSEQLFLQLCELNRVSDDKDKDQHYAACLNNFANLYTEMGRYEKSEPLLLESMEITRRLFGEKDTAFAYSLSNLSALYHSMGQYQKAEPLCLKAIALRKELIGTGHPAYANSLNNLGTLYLEMGLADKAEPLFLESLRIREKTLGRDHPDYAMSLNNLASLYEEKEQYEKAESFYLQANEIRQRTTGTTHPDYAIGLNNLASLYAKMKAYEKSEILMLAAKDTWKTILGEKHPTYALSLNNLAALYRKSGTRYEEAERLYKEALRLRRELLGEAHPLVADTEHDLALLYINMRRFDQAEPRLLTSARQVQQNLFLTFPVLSEKEKTGLLRYHFIITETGNSLLYNYPRASPAFIKHCFNLQLGLKSLSLTDTRNILEAVRNSPDTAIRRLFGLWQSNRLLLVKQYALPLSQRQPGLDEVESETESIEKELNRLSVSFRNQREGLEIKTESIRDQLEPGEAAIEFVRFRLYRDNWEDSILYAAYILKKQDSLPVFVPLFEERQLEALCLQKGRTPTLLAKNLYTAGAGPGDKKPTAGDSLYALVWKPLEPFLEGVHKIAFAPAGKLYGIAFHALPAGDNRLLVDRYLLRQYVSTRQLAFREKMKTAVPGAIVLFGDPSFSMDSAAIAAQKKDPAVSVLLPEDGITRGGLWMDLPGTGEEVNRIRELFHRNRKSTTLFSKTMASEENVKALGNQAPPVLHIATHGFFLPDPGLKQETSKKPQGISYRVADDPLLRSGLILAGGNYAWSGKRPVEGAEDGVLTAYEIAQMNLSGTALVTLSACETGLGDVKGSEGVFGLQRAFKMAGTDKLLVSLWEVPDRETVELMTGFYSYWLSGLPLTEAFHRSRGDMRKKYPPYYWAAFVLIE